MKKIILTGGGTAGHVIPNLALVPRLKELGYQIVYVGGKNGMERNLVAEAKLPYMGISAGKLRRYVDIRNFTDAFRVLKGFGDAVKIIRREKPDVVFSKGGFVTVPVVVAAKFCGVPAILHESDLTPGLANRLSLPFASVICTSFPETAENLKKASVTGSPIRAELFEGNRERGLAKCGFQDKKPVILVIGGSSGSVKINAAIRGILDKLLRCYHVIHLCGKGNVDDTIQRQGYKQFEFLSAELPDILAAADVVISRAGANTIFELLALKKPNLLIPLSKNASRGDQILNAKSFEAQGFSKALFEEDITGERLLTEIIDLYASRDRYTLRMSESGLNDATVKICETIEGCVIRRKK